MQVRAIDFLLELEQVIQSRAIDRADGSYTASLFAAGTKRIAQKLGEEGVELALAAATKDKDEVVNEAADLVYHMIVLLTDQDITLNDIAMKLRERHQVD